ncbi:MAG: AAA family ATPase [Streptococcaceae bacterium]|jgi:uncharacterized protein YhaN|nr:AAA family ATPase [Streptococcaceae bacterium]
MKIEQLEIFGFGKFSEKTFTLHDKQLIFGENEAGKSTLFSFIKFMLFGFKAKDKTHREFKPLAAKVYGGRLTLSDMGHQYIVERSGLNNRSNKQEVHFTKDGTVLSAKAWEEFLAPMTQELFEKVYTLTQENLSINAEKDMGEDELEALWKVTASMGTQELTGKIISLNKEIPELYKVSGKNPELNQLLDKLAKLKQQIEIKIAEADLLLPNVERINQLNQQFIESEGIVKKLRHTVDELRHKRDYQADYEQLKELSAIDFSQILSAEELRQLEQSYLEISESQRALELILKEIATEESILSRLNTDEQAFYIKKQGEIETLVAEIPKIYGILKTTEILEDTLRLKQNESHRLAQDYQLENRQLYSNQALQALAQNETQGGRQSFSIINLIIPIIISALIAFVLRKQPLIAAFASVIIIYLGYQLMKFLNPKPSVIAETITFEAASEHNQRLLQVNQLNEEVATLTRQLQDNQVALDEFSQAIAEISAFLGTARLDLSDRLSQINIFYQEEEANRKQLTSLQTATKKGQAAALEADIKQLKIKYPDFEEIPQQAQKQQILNNQREQLEHLKKRLAQYFDLSQPVDFEQLLLDLARRQNELHAQQIKLENLRNERSKLKIEINFLQTDGTLDELYQQRATLESEIEAKTETWALKSGLIAAYQSILAELSEITLPEILTLAKEYFLFLTNDNYQDLFLENKVLKVRLKTEQSLRVLDLSTGTKDQLLLALRFALIQSKKLNFPIFVDDAFLRYDSKRKLRVFELFEQYKASQLIIFSSDSQIKLFFETNNEAIEVLN